MNDDEEDDDDGSTDRSNRLSSEFESCLQLSIIRQYVNSTLAAYTEEKEKNLWLTLSSFHQNDCSVLTAQLP